MPGSRRAAMAACTANMAESAPPLSATATRTEDDSACSRDKASARGSSSSLTPNSSGRNGRTMTASGVRFGESSVGHEALQALFDQLFRCHAGYLPQGVGQCTIQLVGHHDRISVRAANGFVHDTVDQTEVLQTIGGNGERLGRHGRLIGTAPKNGSTAFGRNDRVGG